MSKKQKIRVVTLGTMPKDLDLSKVITWSSSIFEVIDTIDNFTITSNADGEDWQFTDDNLSKNLPNNEGEDFLVVLTNVPLEHNWYTRRIQENKVVFSFNEISDYLRFNNIPLENVVFRLLYAYVLVFKENKGRIPSCEEITNFTHDETKGCIYDMNGLKYDIIHSCESPIICSTCAQRLASSGVSTSQVDRAQKEIKHIRKDLFFQISDWISRHPILSLALATLWAFLIALLTEYVAKELWSNV
ncbi:MAG: hypothetical protein AB2536_17550 [Candidatus Thiodiazotropha endolucinida]